MDERTMDTTELSFEQALTRLEEIVALLDAADRPLEEALRLYEEGMALKRRCAEQLAQAEARVEMLAAEGGNGNPGTGLP